MSLNFCIEAQEIFSSAKNLFFGSGQVEVKKGGFAGYHHFILGATYFLPPPLQRFLHLRQEPIRGRAVKDAVIEHKRQIHHRADGNRVIYDDNPLLHRADA